MSRNYDIDQRELETAVQAAREKLDYIYGILPKLESAKFKHSDRNTLTRTVDFAFAFVRKYLPPIHWFFAAMTAVLMFFYARIVAMTTRFEARGAVVWPHVPSPSVFALWHRDAPSLLVAFAKRPLSVRTVIMVSRDPRGDYLAMLSRMVGFSVVRGDSESGGREALQELINELSNGACVILTADGGGPARVAKVGAVGLASSAGVPLIPVAADCHPAIEERHKWDAARNPLPFGKLLVRLGPPLRLAPLLDLPSIENARRRLEMTLNRFDLDAVAAVRSLSDKRMRVPSN